MQALTSSNSYPQNISLWGDKALTWMEGVQDNYTPHIKHFVRFAQETSGTVDIETIRAYYLHLNESDYSASTIRVRRQAVKKRVRELFADTTEEERAFLEVQLNRLDKADSTKCPGGSSKGINSDMILKPGEYEKVHAGARSERQRRFIEFLYTTGCRVSEMCKVKITDCKVESGYVTVRLQGKGNRTMKVKQRYVYIPVAMYERILATFQGERYLFETGNGRTYDRGYITKQLRKITLKTIGRALSAHKFRHTFATRKIQETGRVKAVSEYLGHSDVQITLRIYSHDTFSPSDVLGPEAVA